MSTKAVIRRLLPLVMVLIVAGCGVQIEVAPTAVPTSFPHPTVYPGASSNSLRRSIAAPRLVFANDAKAHIFVAAPSPDMYVLRDRQATLSVDYDVTWFEDSQGQVHVRLTVYTRMAQGWVIYDSVERTLSTTGTPSSVHGSLTVVLGSEASGQVEIRAEVAVIANHSNGSEAKQAGATEFKAIMLANPGPIKPDFAALKPAMGDLDPSIVLIDWRGWVGDPCALLPLATADPSYPAVQASCLAATHNPQQVIKDLGQALTTARHPGLVARLNDMLGLALMVQKNFAEASLHFSNAVSAWQAAGRAWELTVSLHNLACARVMQGDGTSAFSAFIQLQELHAQYTDEAGQMLTLANVALVSGDKESLRQAHNYFQANRLPQAAISDVWLRRLEGRQ